MKAVLVAVATATLLAGCASNTGAGGPAAATDPMSPLSAPGYMRMAASSDMFEIESSRIALVNSQSPQVRSFAQMMIDHHTRTTQELTTVATQARFAPPAPQMLPPQMAALDRVRAAQPGEFDSVYKREQIAGHQEALSLHRSYGAQGDTPALREFANRTVPIIESHLGQAQNLPEYAPPPPPPPPRAGERG
jgi:putative membrane protein